MQSIIPSVTRRALMIIEARSVPVNAYPFKYKELQPAPAGLDEADVKFYRTNYHIDSLIDIEMITIVVSGVCL